MRKSRASFSSPPKSEPLRLQSLPSSGVRGGVDSPDEDRVGIARGMAAGGVLDSGGVLDILPME